MRPTALARAAHLVPYLRVLRDAGVRFDRQIVLAGLPTRAEEMPDEYLSLPRVLDFVGRCTRDADVMTFGYRAAKLATLDALTPQFQSALLDAPSGLMRLKAFLRGMVAEDSALRPGLVFAGDRARLVCDLGAFRNSPGVAAAEWLTLNASIQVMRTLAGRDWVPEEITFTARQKPSDEALEAFGNTRILTGQRVSSIIIPVADLARPCARPDTSAAVPTGGALALEADEVTPLCLVEVLRRLIRPYLGDGVPDIDSAAEVVGMSRRSLQRHLAKRGRTYSDLLVEARYDVACDLLANPSLKIIDVSMAAGYGHPQHFSRAFRKVAGISPRAYRQGLLQPA